MLRILVFDEPFSVKMRLEGELTDETTPQLTQRWAEVRSRLRDRRAILDLGDVIKVDQAGRQLLSWLTDSGVRFSYAHPVLQPLVEELTRRRAGNSGVLSGVRKRLYVFLCSMLPSRLRPCGCGSN